MSKTGEFRRDAKYLDGRITADGSDGWPVAPQRYRLVVARGCPWANRTMIVRRLLGLEGALSMGICGPTHDWRSWTFDLDPGEKDPVLGIHWLREAYEKAVPGYDRGVTVPAIVDIPSGAVVTADFRHITLGLESEWRAYHRPGAPRPVPGRTRGRDRRGQRPRLQGRE
jgi:putative glutathione S-transferase